MYLVIFLWINPEERFLKKRFLGIVVLIQFQEAYEYIFEADQYAPNTLQSSMSLNSRGMAGL